MQAFSRIFKRTVTQPGTEIRGGGGTPHAVPWLVLPIWVVAGCVATTPAPPAPPKAPPPDPVAALAAIRAAGANVDSAVQVRPLMAPDLEAMLRDGEEAEAAGRLDVAATMSAKALQRAPDSPDALQLGAEVAVAKGNWREAEILAMKSYQLGPRSGALCARNWQTVVEARRAFGDAATVARARKAVADCRVAPPVRM